jgi:hypothetical protein
MANRREAPGPTAPLVETFHVKIVFLWQLVAIGVTIGLLGAMLMGDAVSWTRIGILVAGLLLALVPFQLARRAAGIRFDYDAGTMSFVPGGETLPHKEVEKIHFNRFIKAVTVDIENPSWSRTMHLGFVYPMLVRPTLRGYRLNATIMADREGFLKAMHRFADVVASRAYTIDLD